jgi:hypothetical protein
MQERVEAMLIDVSQDRCDGIGRVGFHHVPRVGEHIALPGQRGQDVYEVTVVLHTADPIGDAVDLFIRKVGTLATFVPGRQE